MTRLLSIFQDLHFNIRNNRKKKKRNNRNRVDNRTLDAFMAGTERGLDPVKRSRGHIFPIFGARETLHMCRKAPWGSKRREHHPIICDAKAVP